MQVFGKALSFGVVDEAPAAERNGFDGVRVIDHFFSGIPPEPPVAVPHAVATLTAAAVLTQRVTLTQTVFAATMRHPFELAQAVATIDRISGGRAELGVGAGWLPDEHEANGLPLGSPRDRVDRLTECVTIAAGLLRSGGVIDFEGAHFRSHCAAPWPATPHTPEVMVGAHGHYTIRRVAPIVDRIDILEAMIGGRPCFDGDHSNSLEQLQRRMDIARTEAGDGVKFSATVNLRIVPSSSAAREAREELARLASCDVATIEAERLRLISVDDDALDRFSELATLGIDRVHVRPMDEMTQQWLVGALPALQSIRG
jgi:alkanesulfonate monooxygenase SsuD/methylene tetrahydromethanopterin reductase-like flavin-dependent oxidoreductase (luciferase family)